MNLLDLNLLLVPSLITIFSEFPSTCQFFKGPHVKACLITLWFKVGCSEQGYGFPGNLTNSRLAVLNDLNLV